MFTKTSIRKSMLNECDPDRILEWVVTVAAKLQVLNMKHDGGISIFTLYIYNVHICIQFNDIIITVIVYNDGNVYHFTIVISHL